MGKFLLWPVVAAVLASTGVALAAESMSGRWAEDEAACAAFGTAKSALVVSDTSLRWRDETCRTGRQYRTGDTLHVEAFCHGGTVPVSLRLAGDRIVVNWARVLQGQLQRCH